MASRNYRDLIAWQKAIDLVTEVYRATSGFPREEVYALTSQLRRAAVSVPSNIAEGQGRASEQEFTRFLRISRGSLSELETQLVIAERLKYIGQEILTELLDRAAEVGRLINGLLRSKGEQI